MLTKSMHSIADDVTPIH